MTFNFLHNSRFVSTLNCTQFKVSLSDNTFKLSLSKTTEQLKRSIDMNHSKSDNTARVQFSIKSVNTDEASTQMYNKSESAQTGRATKVKNL